VDLAKGAVAVGKGVSATTMLVLQELSLLEQRWMATLADAKRGDDALQDITDLDSFTKWSPKGFAEIGKGGGLSSYKILRAKGAFAAAAVGAGLALVGAIVCMGFALANRPDDWAILAYGLQAVGVALAGVGLISSVGSLLKSIKLGTWNIWKPCEALPRPTDLSGQFDKMKVGMAVIGTLINLALNVELVIQVTAGGLAASMA
jgi:hypothetical protein